MVVSSSRSRSQLLDMRIPLFLVSLFLSLPWHAYSASSLGPRAFHNLSTDAISALVAHPDPVRNVDPKNSNSHLSKILIPRVPDTANNTLVKDYIVSTMKKLKWHVEEDNFNDTTPYGVKNFTNVIATKDPTALRRVVVSAHFDSKYFPRPPQDQVRDQLSLVNKTLITTSVVCWRHRLGRTLRIYA